MLKWYDLQNLFEIDIKNWLQHDMNMYLSGVVESPILGPSGNKEFVIVANK